MPGVIALALSLTRLQLAQRIHELLLREIGHAIEVERLLADPRYARDVLLVCDAGPGGELQPLVSLFRQASRPMAARPDDPGHAPQPNDWGHDTSGFGVTQPPPMPGTGSARRASDSEPAPLDSPRRSWLPRWRGPK